MGGLNLENHWNRMVLASVREFIDAEDYAAGLWAGGDKEAAQATAYEALRRGMTAAIFLHHFSEVAVNRDPQALQGKKLADVYQELQNRTVAADSAARPDDWKILKEVADAIKHAELTAKHIQHVEKDGRVIEWTHDASGQPWIGIPTTKGTRLLRELLQNVCGAWSGWLGLPAL